MSGGTQGDSWTAPVPVAETQQFDVECLSLPLQCAIDSDILQVVDSAAAEGQLSASPEWLFAWLTLQSASLIAHVVPPTGQFLDPTSLVLR